MFFYKKKGAVKETTADVESKNARPNGGVNDQKFCKETERSVFHYDFKKGLGTEIT